MDGQSHTNVVDTLARQIASRAGASAVFGAPVTRGHTTVIPVARTVFGLGGGRGPGKEATESEGGGGGAAIKPLGYIQLRNGRATYKPIRDPWLIAFGTLGLLILARTYTLARQRTTRCPECGRRAHEPLTSAVPAQPASDARRPVEATRRTTEPEPFRA